MKTRLLLPFAAIPALALTAAAQVTTLVHAMDDIQALTPIDDEYALFFGDEGAGLGTELYRWRADTGVLLVKDLIPGSQSSSFGPFHKAWLGGQRTTLFIAWGTATPQKLWRTDGTPAGTQVVFPVDMPGQPAPAVGLQELVFHPQAGKAFFSASGLEGGLWATDGTPAGTVRVLADPNPPTLLVPFGRGVFFKRGSASIERFDTVTGQITTVAGIPPGLCSELVPLGDALVLVHSANFSSNARKLWRIDPVSMTASVVVDFDPNGFDGVDVLGRAEHAGAFYLMAYDGTGVRHLYRTDLTAAGTQKLGVAPVAYDRFDEPGAVGSGWLATTSLIVTELSVKTPVSAFDSFGGGAPSELGVESRAFVAGAMPAVYANGGIFFQGNLPNGPDQLFFTDGTVAGTQPVSVTIPHASTLGADIVICDGRVLFDGKFDAVTQGLLEYTLPGAYAAELGGISGTPRLRATDPILGSTVQMSGQGAQAGSVGILAYSLPPTAPLNLGIGVPLWVDPNGAFLIPGLLTPTWSRTFPLPNDPNLAGAKFNLQAWFANPITGLIEGSNALRMNLAP